MKQLHKIQLRKRQWNFALATLIFLALVTNGLGGTWTPLVNQAPAQINTMVLLSDGTVLGEEYGYGNDSTAWYRLTPDIHGSYVHGTWTSVASMHYPRLFFASQVLTNGSVFVAGAEYGYYYATNNPGNNSAETYDPLANTWTLVAQAPPEGLADAISMVLPDGRVLLGPANCNGDTVLYDLVAGTVSVGPHTYNSGCQNEASWVKLPDNSILTVDRDTTHSERFIPSLNQWVQDGNVPVPLYSGSEIGAALLLPNGKAFFLGATGNTALYTPSGTTSPGTWTAGPIIPAGLTPPDAPAAMLVDGNVLCAVTDQTDTYFYEYDPTANQFTQVNGPTGLTFPGATDYLRMLDLPDGTVLFGYNSQQFYIYQPSGSALTAGKPSIKSISPNSDGSFTLAGTLLNGISAGAAYGDDAQMDSNYPLVRMTNNSTGNVYYARTYNWSSTGVMTGSNIVTTRFTLPKGLPGGLYSLIVVANGIASDSVSFAPPNSPLLQAQQGKGVVLLSWNGSASNSYQLQYNTNLLTTNWINLGGVLPGTNGIMRATNSTVSNRQQFFRISLQH